MTHAPLRIRAVLLTAALLLFTIAGAAHAERRATRAQSRQMWATVFAKYGYEGCVQHRGEISTTHTRKKYGIVTIADNHCGNGSFILSTRRHAGHSRWRVLGAGSDWGAPERCASDLRRIPRSVLKDFFGPGICRDARSRDLTTARLPFGDARDVVIRNPDGSVYTETVDPARRSTTCGVARRVARPVVGDDGEGVPSPLGFKCVRTHDGFLCNRRAP